MGWFDNPRECEPAIEHAVKIARNKKLPITARSRTLAELNRFHGRLALFLGAVYVCLIGGLLLSVALDSGQASRSILIVAAPIAVAGGLLIPLLARWRRQKNAKYRDPGIEVQVGADGIIVSGAGGDYGIRWHEIDAQLNWITVKHGTAFVGTWLHSPLGLIDLREETYRNGRSAAALIVRGMHDDYWRTERDKVERVA